MPEAAEGTSSATLAMASSCVWKIAVEKEVNGLLQHPADPTLSEATPCGPWPHPRAARAAVRGMADGGMVLLERGGHSQSADGGFSLAEKKKRVSSTTCHRPKHSKMLDIWAALVLTQQRAGAPPHCFEERIP